MFDKLKGMTGQFQMLQRMMKDENFRAFIAHPKVQEVFKDLEFQKLVKENNVFKLMSHPKFSGLMQDPEVRNLMLKLNPQSFSNG